MQDTFGEVFPCYMPLHDLEISKTLKGKVYITGMLRTPSLKIALPKMRVSLGGGGTVIQDIHKDKTPRLWNWDVSQVINIQILNAVAFKSVTGINPPIPAISFEEYTRAGLPLLSFQEPNESQVSKLIAAPGACIKSFRQIDEEHGLAIGIRVRKDNGPVICSWCEHRLCDSILLPCRHIFCTWCVRVQMTRRKVVSCKFCNLKASNVKIYAAATAVGDAGPKQEDKAAPLTMQPVQKLEELCRNRVRWGGEADSLEYKPVHALVLDGGTGGRKVGDSDWNLMIAQVLREWEIGLRTEEEVRDLASYALTSGGAAAEGTPEALEILLSLGAKPRNAEEMKTFLQALEERKDLGSLRKSLLAEWELGLEYRMCG
ncbi:hypothetical protein BKA59DRAFT_461553 [Fusarium tricinctum]|uniref:RING-type domain-containing protein n=1 Tax=Fusarium tricinctum TaxID=61284 RepID=A0A8K0SA65_9HYPO|nr:hypothetical protein BKA59DRAFT_461553 [Fusarium tricinctum]